MLQWETRAGMASLRSMEIPRFDLGEKLSPDQQTFLDQQGFVLFKNFLKPEEVAEVLGELQALEQKWVSEKKDKAFGIPIAYRTGLDGQPYVSRFAFASCYSEKLHRFLSSDRFNPIKAILGPGFRLGEREKDGMVVNHYLNREGGGSRKDLGWHTDSPRDLFLGRKIRPLWQIGIYLDDSPKAKGGLRLIPGTHKQSIWKMLFRKMYFLDRKADPEEICVEAKAGDLTIHDGRLWHRVASAAVTGEASRRRVIYLPFIEGPKQEKSESSPTPLYHRLQKLAG
jgi:phytanoyl-CoA hydroxylase